jgi:hypothetical protein
VREQALFEGAIDGVMGGVLFGIARYPAAVGGAGEVRMEFAAGCPHGRGFLGTVSGPLGDTACRRGFGVVSGGGVRQRDGHGTSYPGRRGVSWSGAG